MTTFLFTDIISEKARIAFEQYLEKDAIYPENEAGGTGKMEFMWTTEKPPSKYWGEKVSVCHVDFRTYGCDYNAPYLSEKARQLGVKPVVCEFWAASLGMFGFKPYNGNYNQNKFKMAYTNPKNGQPNLLVVIDSKKYIHFFMTPQGKFLRWCSWQELEHLKPRMEWRRLSRRMGMRARKCFLTRDNKTVFAGTRRLRSGRPSFVVTNEEKGLSPNGELYDRTWTYTLDGNGMYPETDNEVEVDVDVEYWNEEELYQIKDDGTEVWHTVEKATVYIRETEKPI